MGPTGTIKSLQFTTRRCDSAVYILSSCVCLSVYPSQAGIVQKLLSIESRKQRHTLRILAKFQRGHTNGGQKLRWCGLKEAIFDQYLDIGQILYTGSQCQSYHTDNKSPLIKRCVVRVT